MRKWTIDLINYWNMENKHLLIICSILVLFTSSLFGQEDGITLTYNVFFKEDASFKEKSKSLDSRAYEYINKYLLENAKIIETVTFEVKANRNEYRLSYEKPILEDGKSGRVLIGAVSRAIDSEYIYSDLTTKKSYLKSVKYGNQTIDREITMSDVVWDLRKETKTILGKLCFKAVGTLCNNGGHPKNFPVIAWYSPELSFQCGPTPYATLPGVILQMENDIWIKTATAYKLEKNKIKPYKQGKNESMTYAKYNDYIVKWRKENDPRALRKSNN
jgi:GLPGLI family protein